MPVEVALVSETGRGGRLGDRVASFEQAPGGAEAVGDLECMRGQAGTVAEQADEAELPNPGGVRKLVETDVVLGLLCEVVVGGA